MVWPLSKFLWGVFAPHHSRSGAIYTINPFFTLVPGITTSARNILSRFVQPGRRPVSGPVVAPPARRRPCARQPQIEFAVDPCAIRREIIHQARFMASQERFLAEVAIAYGLGSSCRARPGALPQLPRCSPRRRCKGTGTVKIRRAAAFERRSQVFGRWDHETGGRHAARQDEGRESREAPAAKAILPAGSIASRRRSSAERRQIERRDTVRLMRLVPILGGAGVHFQRHGEGDGGLRGALHHATRKVLV
jgi:hypothetical protein